ncbi:hypothetical protein J4410_06075 [Candidatus Woesearchaeota archaeon]|nr:hypothetical protein [Candidatus Woesearchaeota archaeon]
MKITSIKSETDDTKIFRFKYTTDERMDFKAGQFVMVHDIQVEKDGEKKKVNRAYSIASSPGKDFIDLVIKEEHPGLTSSYWVNKVKKDQEFEIKGPYGKFMYTEDVKGDVVLLGAGSGIAPLRGIAQFITEKKLPVKVFLVFSNKTSRDIICKSEFLDMEENNDNFEVHFTVTREPEDSDWEGRRGRIDYEFLEDSIGFLENKVFYVCGSKEFGTGVIDLLKEHGVSEEKIKKEIY